MLELSEDANDCIAECSDFQIQQCFSVYQLIGLKPTGKLDPITGDELLELCLIAVSPSYYELKVYADLHEINAKDVEFTFIDHCQYGAVHSH